jgi:hypothetical protein
MQASTLKDRRALFRFQEGRAQAHDDERRPQPQGMLGEPLG